MDGRDWGSHVSPRRWLKGESQWFHFNLRGWLWGERWRFSWQSQMLVVGRERWAGCGRERPGFSQQSQRLVVVARGRGSHGSPRRWLFWLERQSQTLGLGGGEAVFLMAVADDGCGWERQGSPGSPRRWLWSGEAWFLMAVSRTGCGEGAGGGSHHSPRHWLSGGEAEVLMAVSKTGCGGAGGGSHGSLIYLL